MFLHRVAGSLTEWKDEIGDCVQDFLREALFPEWSFSCPSGRAQNAGECASRVMKTKCSRLAGAKRTLLQSWRMEWSLAASRCFSGMSGQVEWKS